VKTVVIVLGVATTLLAVWGLFAPRGLWNSLFGWSFADQRAGEPGGGSYLARRLLLGLGLAAIATIGILFVVQTIVNPPKVAPPPTPIEQMWGSGSHEVVNRVVSPISGPPTGFTEIPVLDYQAISDEDGPGDYLRLLPKFAILGSQEIPGLIGSPPSDGYSATDTAELILHVRGPLLCVPRAALVMETAESVTVAVYYGLPDQLDPATPVDNAVSCPADSSVTASVLLPIELQEELGDRPVLTLTGEELKDVQLIEK
jgi:hypothetical protein